MEWIRLPFLRKIRIDFMGMDVEKAQKTTVGAGLAI